MGEGRYRNERCRCGSGKKYKACHLTREDQERTNPFALQQSFRKRKQKRRMCLHPAKSDCSGSIVKAHTIQRSGGLTAIAEAGHVLGLDADIRTLQANSGRVGVRLVGVKKASTFTGFCARHDNEVFAPIERNGFRACPEHAFLTAYRTLCRELYQKEAAHESTDLLRGLDAGRSPEWQVAFQRFLRAHERSVEAGISDLQGHKAAYDERLQEQDFSDVGYYVVEFDQAPDVMAAFGIFPSMDFQGRALQDLARVGARLDALSVALIATEAGGAFVLSWIDEQRGACSALAASLDAIDDSEIPDAILRLVFEYSENTFVRPSFWNALDSRPKADLISRISTALDLRIPARPVGVLKSSGYRYASWGVSSRQTNLSLAETKAT